MFRSLSTVLLAPVVMLGVSMAVGAELKCPVGGGAAKASAAADYKGGKVCFCCNKCVSKFKADTAKYAAKANHQLAVSGQFKQAACPISAKPCKASITCEVGGVKVALCCNGCKGKLAGADAKKQFEMVFGKTFDKAFKAAKSDAKK